MTLRTAVSLAALTVALGFAPESMAQTPPAQRAPAVEVPKAPVPGQILVQDANTVLAKQDLIGQTVYAPDKAKIGSISELILSKDGKSVEGFVIGAADVAHRECGYAEVIERLHPLLEDWTDCGVLLQINSANVPAAVIDIEVAGNQLLFLLKLQRADRLP